MTTKTRSKVEQLPTKFHQLFNALAEGQQFIARMAFAALSEAEKTRAERLIDFKKKAYDRAVELGPTVWKNWDLVKDKFFWRPAEPSQSVLAALVYPKARTWAVDRKLIQIAPRYSLLVSFRAETLPAAELDRVLKHELLHMGYSGHGADFRKVCREIGCIVGSDAVTGGEAGTWFEQRQPNGRYKKASPTFETESLAMEWFRHPQQIVARLAQLEEWLAVNPGKARRDGAKALMWRVVHT